MKATKLLAWLACLSGQGSSLALAQSTATQSNPPITELVSRLSAADFDTRLSAGMALDRLGTNAASAVPAIGHLIETEPQKFHDVMLKVVENCPSAGRSIIPTLQRCLTNPSSHLRISSARSLWVLDKGYADQVRQVAKRSLSETDAGVRIEAASLLWRMDKNAKEVVPTLAALLSDPETAYDYRTIRLLGQIGPPARQAIPAVKEWLKSERWREAFVTNAAVQSLRAMDAHP
jgi:HEAT repeat protein